MESTNLHSQLNYVEFKFGFWLTSITYEQLMNAFSLINKITYFGCGKPVVKNYLTSRKNENN